MLSKQSVKKLFRVALYTSPIIGMMIITPTFIMNTFYLNLYSKTVLRLSFFILLIWSVNILLTYLFDNKRYKRNWKLLISYALGGIFIHLFQATLFPFIKNAGFHQTFHYYLIIFCSVNTVILVLQDLILTRDKNALIELENTQLKMKNLEAVNERLKQQIHPHFLFNSLSTLKSLIASSPQNAEDYLIKLSDFLRNSMASEKLNTIILSEELKACVNYLEMQQIRFGDALQFKIDVPEDVKNNRWIPIFSLQVLAENAIKHNAFTNTEPLHIKIAYAENYITVSNNIRQKSIREASAGIGLANLNERYQILSGQEILIQPTTDTFSVSVKVFDNEANNNRG